MFPFLKKQMTSELTATAGELGDLHRLREDQWKVLSIVPGAVLV